MIQNDTSDHRWVNDESIFCLFLISSTYLTVFHRGVILPCFSGLFIVVQDKNEGKGNLCKDINISKI